MDTTKTIENAIVIDIDVTGAYLVGWGEYDGDTHQDTSNCMYLNGVTRPEPDIDVGDKGRLVCKSGPTYSLWFFEKYE